MTKDTTVDTNNRNDDENDKVSESNISNVINIDQIMKLTYTVSLKVIYLLSKTSVITIRRCLHSNIQK